MSKKENSSKETLFHTSLLLLEILTTNNDNMNEHNPTVLPTNPNYNIRHKKLLNFHFTKNRMVYIMSSRCRQVLAYVLTCQNDQQQKTQLSRDKRVNELVEGSAEGKNTVVKDLCKECSRSPSLMLHFRPCYILIF